MEQQSKLPIILITSLFLIWGLFNNMTDTLLAAFKKIMDMSDFKTSMIQVAFYGSYFCLAIPAALYIKKYSYKSGILLGLGIFIIGAFLFYPASRTMNYNHFLLALFVLAGGLAILETTANPYVVAMGTEETATRRLNFAQSFNPIGSILGILIGQKYILSQLNPVGSEERNQLPLEEMTIIQAQELNAVMTPYVLLACLLILWWILIFFANMPKASMVSSPPRFQSTLPRLLSYKNYRYGLIAQFFYVGAQIGIWSFTIRYVMEELQLSEESGASYYLASLILFMSARFICTYLMKFITPSKILSTLSVFAIIALTFAIAFGGYLGVYALILVSGCMSLMYPTIFSLAITGLKQDTKIGSSGLVMTIIGGAILTPIQGWVSDLSQSIQLSFLIPLIAFVVIFAYGVYSTQLTYDQSIEI